VKSIIGEERFERRTRRRLDLEITESLIMRNIGEIIPRLKALRESGVEIMVDDFGTGHSSLATLPGFPSPRSRSTAPSSTACRRIRKA